MESVASLVKKQLEVSHVWEGPLERLQPAFRLVVPHAEDVRPNREIAEIEAEEGLG